MMIGFAKRFVLALMAIVTLVIALPTSSAWGQAPDSARAWKIAKEAYLYGHPMVDNYRIMHAYFVDAENPQYKAPFNTLKNIPRVYTPEDTAVQTPNSDTPYSMLGMDLRAQPLILEVPKIEKNRYFSIQLIDAYTFNFDYIGSRATGNDGGTFMVTGPNWKGEVPEGITKVFHSDTEFAMAIYRTQLFDVADLDNVKKIQAGYKVKTLTEYLNLDAEVLAPKVDFPKPLTPEEEKTSLELFNILNWILQYCPTDPSEKELMDRFRIIGVGAGKHIDVAQLNPEMKKALNDGIADAWKAYDHFLKDSVETGKVSSGEMFGTRAYLKNNYLYRFSAAVLGIYGNSKQEAMYPTYRADDAGKPMDASKHDYTVRFAPGQLPPVHAFWSLTMYDLPASLLVANPLHRYLINSPMLPELKLDADGGLTLYLQHDSPGTDKESNWLPAPDGPFWVAMRLYWPKEAALDGGWSAPPMKMVQ